MKMQQDPVGGGQQKIIFWGGTLQCVSLREYLPENFRLTAIFDNNPNLKSPFDDVPLYHGKSGFYEWKKTLSDDELVYFAVAIAGDFGRDRCEVGDFLSSEGLQPYNVISNSAIISPSVKIGRGVQIMSSAIIDARAEVGDYAIINLGAILGHGCKIGRGVHLGANVIVAGSCTIDDYVTVWTGASVAPRLHIGEGATVGIGSSVIRNVKPNVTVFGHPAMPLPTMFSA